MADIVDKTTRSRMMTSIRGKNTGIELLMRRGLFRTGLRFRLHVKTLAGKPDLVFPRYRAVLFIHGCFWHGHDCRLFRMPETRREFWLQKIHGNIDRDRRNSEILRESGWRIGVVWECALRGKSESDFHQVLESVDNWLKSGEVNYFELPMAEE